MARWPPSLSASSAAEYSRCRRPNNASRDRATPPPDRSRPPGFRSEAPPLTTTPELAVRKTGPSAHPGSAEPGPAHPKSPLRRMLHRPGTRRQRNLLSVPGERVGSPRPRPAHQRTHARCILRPAGPQESKTRARLCPLRGECPPGTRVRIARDRGCSRVAAQTVPQYPPIGGHRIHPAHRLFAGQTPTQAPEIVAVWPQEIRPQLQTRPRTPPLEISAPTKD